MNKLDKSQVQTWTNPRHKVIGIPLQKGMEKQKDGSLLVRGMFTSDQKDEVGDIITRSATERAIPKYKQWGNIRYMHQPIPVGIVVRIGAEDGLGWNEVEIKVISPQAVFEVEQGLLKALSVGIMVRFDDVDFMEDGGLIINDYQLAEISLVDHPANYDARLLREIPVEQGLELMVRHYGMDTLARSMMALLDREKTMSDIPATENAAIETEPEVTPVEEQPVEVVERSAEETEEVVSEETPVEEPAADEPAEEEVPAEEPVEEPVEAVEEVTLSDLKGLLNDVLAVMRSLPESLAAAVKSLEAPAEVPQAEEQPVSEETTQVEASLDAAPAEDTDPEPGPAANRKGAVPETEIPSDTAPAEQEAVQKTDLRSALSKYFEAKNGLR